MKLRAKKFVDGNTVENNTSNKLNGGGDVTRLQFLLFSRCSFFLRGNFKDLKEALPDLRIFRLT